MFGAKALTAFDRFIDALEARACDRQVLCGEQPDATRCRQTHQFLATPFFSQVRAGVQSGGTGVVPGASDALVDTLVPAECLNNPDRPVESAVQFVFQGRAAPGESCWIQTDCSGSSRCDHSQCDPRDTCCAGVCVGYVREAGEGEPRSFADCGPGLSCARRFGAIADDGSSTSDEEPYCYPALSEGAACGNRTTLEGGCDDNTLCREDSSGELQCLAGLPLEGESCRTDFGATGCGQSDLGCIRTDAAPDAPVCARRQPSGSPCRGDEECLQQAKCIEGQCQARPALGDSCVPDGMACLFGTYCHPATGRCEPSFGFLPCGSITEPRVANAGLPGPAGATVPLVPLRGLVDVTTNTVGVHGAFRAGSDSQDLFMAGILPGDSVVQPTSFMETDGPEVCIAGEVGQVIDGDYRRHWGVVLSFTPDVRSGQGWSNPDVVGFRYTLTGPRVPRPESLRLRVGYVDPSSSLAFACAPVPAAPGVAVTTFFPSLRVRSVSPQPERPPSCAAPGEPPMPVGAALLAVEWAIEANAVRRIPFDFCLRDLQAVLRPKGLSQ